MFWKIALLAAVAAVMWWLTRPKPPVAGKVKETRLVQCAECGVYHAADEPCNCKK